jgi:hypothetical protein
MSLNPIFFIEGKYVRSRYQFFEKIPLKSFFPKKKQLFQKILDQKALFRKYSHRNNPP